MSRCFSASITLVACSEFVIVVHNLQSLFCVASLSCRLALVILLVRMLVAVVAVVVVVAIVVVVI